MRKHPRKTLEKVLGKKRKLKTIMIVILALAVILLIVVRPGSEEKEFEIEDKCGPVMGTILHTVKDEAVCKTRCRAQCGATDYKYKKIIFERNLETCNYCKCYCRR